MHWCSFSGCVGVVVLVKVRLEWLSGNKGGSPQSPHALECLFRNELDQFVQPPAHHHTSIKQLENWGRLW